jgi:FMN phosphatase YigB (HAD superfamily)
MSFVGPSVVLWDFGDTLVDERWMRTCPESCPTWEAAWIAVMRELADRWNVGEISFTEVSAALADAAAMTVPEVEAHARACCAQLSLHSNAWALARQRRWPQAIVTVNPDLFADFIVPNYGLSEMFDQIIMSFAEKTDDKVALCDIALERLGYRGARDRAVLIDNRLNLVDAWRDSGGAGYWFRSDDQFGRDAPLDDD